MSCKYLEEGCFKLHCLYILSFYVIVYNGSGFFQKYAMHQEGYLLCPCSTIMGVRASEKKHSANKLTLPTF